MTVCGSGCQRTETCGAQTAHMPGLGGLSLPSWLRIRRAMLPQRDGKEGFLVKHCFFIRMGYVSETDKILNREQTDDRHTDGGTHHLGWLVAVTIAVRLHA